MYKGIHWKTMFHAVLVCKYTLQNDIQLYGVFQYMYSILGCKPKSNTCTEIPYSGKVSRTKSFANFAKKLVSAKVLFVNTQ